MIDTYGELLLEFMRAEQRKLDEFDLRHGPTIGDMYEGLTQQIVRASLPDGADLRVVNGFITDGSGFYSRQIDCMLVQGQGDRIPHTEAYVWHVKDVIAVLEVKKTAYTADIADAIGVLQSVSDCQSAFLQASRGERRTVDTESAEYAFAQATKTLSPGYQDVESLPFELQMVFHNLIMEQVSPIFVVLGYSGFRSEAGFREGILGLVQAEVGEDGGRMGVPSFPQLIISGAYSAVKTNGQPFIGPVENGTWQFVATCSENPAVLLLELLWTRLQLLFGGSPPWGEDLETQQMHRFLGARAKRVENRVGWEYFYVVASEDELSSTEVRAPWSPAIVTLEESVVLARIFQHGRVSVADNDFRNYVESHGRSVEKVVDSILNTSLVAMDGQDMVSIARVPVTAVLPDGRTVVGDDNTGRLTRWVLSQMSDVS